MSVRFAASSGAAARMSLAMLVFLSVSLTVPQVVAQGFSGLGSSAEGFALPDPEYRLEFPRDHGPHPDFRIEWWYVTANMTGGDGRDYGLQWTLFRTALGPGEDNGWQSPQLWMGHAAVTAPDAHFVTERRARGGIGQAGVRAEPFAAWIDEWRMGGEDIGTVQLTAQGPDFGYDVRLAAEGPLVLQGDEGYSVKSAEGQASHYYSQPHYRLTGRLRLPDGEVEVAGTAWFDREWSSQPLGADQTGWDWFSLHFDGGDKLMAYRLRDAEGSPYMVATWIAPDGTPTPYEPGALTAEPLESARVAGRDIPVRWRLRMPARALDIDVMALNPQSWMATSVAYWEGPVFASGSHPGRGYLEMTGYE